MLEFISLKEICEKNRCFYTLEHEKKYFDRDQQRALQILSLPGLFCRNCLVLLCTFKY